jgi:putative sugar O-methyltransferase
MSKIKKIIDDPKYALHIFISQYLKISFVKKVFSQKPEYRSDSENGTYAAVILKSLKDQKSFDNFKRSYYYREILEHVNYDQGSKYLDIVLSRNDGLFETALGSVLKMDEVGNPIKYKYSALDKNLMLSPTSLRYLKVTSDLKGLFGSNIERVAEIGCGYGGQALMNDQLLEVNHVTLFDLPFVNQLITRYLNSMLLNGTFKTTTINESLAENYDLVISNYAFSELPSMLQLSYIKKVLMNSKRGYLTMNSGLLGERSEGKLSLEQLKKILPLFEIYEEEPNTYVHNYIIIWGHDEQFAEKYLTRKILK